MTTPPSGPTLRPPLKADRDGLARFLKDKRPILWVGAGASVAAGYPGTNDLIRGMVEASEDPIDPDLPFFEIADRFVASQGAGDLADLLQRLLGPPRPPVPLHEAIARLAKAGFFQAIVTTNYEDLLERALAAGGVPYVLQPLEQNAPVHVEGHVRLLKLHGSWDDWLNVVLSGESYARFGRQFPFLVSQLDVLLRQHPVLFIGCSLQDPRILDWLMGLTSEAAKALKPWRPLMTQGGWDAVKTFPALALGNIRPYLLESHGQLGELLHAVAGEVKPDLARLEIEVEVGDRWRARMAGLAWEPVDPLADADLLKALEQLREIGVRPLPTDERGILSPEAAALAGALRSLAALVGERLTSALLSAEARERLEAAVHAGSAGTPPLLVLKVRPAADGLEAERRADRALALPWELLRLEEKFPVEDGTLDLAREAVLDDLPKLTPPDRPLSIVATVAAPVDAGPFDHEEEMYLLWRTLGEKKQEKRLLITDRGMLDDLAGAVERHRPPVVHFTGHGRPGELLFEDEEALSDPVAVNELIRRFRDTGPLPRLIYLSACHGTTAEPAASESHPGERMVDPTAVDRTAPSTAASLHRAGFPQVVAYFGPVHDRQATRAAAAFYTALGRGRTAWEALRQARRVSAEPLRDGGRATHVYPLGWAQLALYHRGPGHATTLPPASGGSTVDLPQEERKRIFERLDHAGGSQRVEHGIVGVQRLRFGFVGRRRERAEAIRRWKKGQRLLVVQGLGGLGKTALCAEVAPLLAETLGSGVRVLALDGRYAGAQADPVVALWQEVQAARTDERWSQVLAGLQKEGLTAEALARALVTLAQAEQGLLVYLDDAESLQVPLGEGELGRWRDSGFAQLWRYLVQVAEEGGPFGVLASSRYQPEGTPSRAVLPLPEMSRYEVVRLLSWMPTLGRMPVADRAWVAERVEGHPRTVEYLEALARTKEEEIVPPGGQYTGERWREEILEPILPETEKKVDSDLLLGKLWESLPPAAQEHLGRCSVLTAPVPWEAIQALAPEADTEDRLFGAGLLSPFQASSGKEVWWAPHRLVAEEAQKEWSGEPKQAHLFLAEWLEGRFKAESTTYWASRTLEHFLAAEEANRAWPIARLLILNLRRAGRYQEALGWVERVLAAGPTSASLGMALTFQAQLQVVAGVSAPEAEAEASLLRALELVEREDKSFVLDELGRLFRHQGQLQKAADYLTRSVEVGIAVKGEHDITVGASLHNLAQVLQAQGDLAGARERLERSLKITVTIYGTEDHPEVAASLHELAQVLKEQGDLAGARQRLERALEIDAQVYGTEDHPAVATSLNNIAGVLLAQGDVSGARHRLERALEIYAKVFGTEDHHEVAASLHELAGVLLSQGDLAGARSRLERSLEIEAKVRGTEYHPAVAASLHSLAGVLQAQGDLAGARQRLEKVLEIEAQVYGTREHYSTAMTEVSLGFLLLQQGEVQKGMELLVHAYTVYQKQLGPDHHYTRQLAQFFAQFAPEAPEAPPP